MTGDRRSPEPRRANPSTPGCQLAGSWTLLRPLAGCGGLGIRSEWPAPPDGGAWPPFPSRVMGHGPRHRPSRPSKPHSQDQPGEDCVLPAAATASRRPRRRPPGNGMVVFVVRAEPNPTASFCPCWVAYRPTPGGISVGRAERKCTARIPALKGEALRLPQRKSPRGERAVAPPPLAGIRRGDGGWRVSTGLYGSPGKLSGNEQPRA